jgi:sialic acid synthase SpsE
MASSPGPRVYVIAEAGVNHNGDPELALELVDAAAAAGADAVKFQTFRAEAVASARAAKAGYQTRTTEAGETQFAMLKRLELPQRVFHGLARRCARLSIEFLSTPFDAESLRFLVEDLNLESLKMASGEITNAPLLLAASRSGRKVILSTGMSTLDEVVDALGVLAFGVHPGPRGSVAPHLPGRFWIEDRAVRCRPRRTADEEGARIYPAASRQPGQHGLCSRSFDDVAG